MKNKTAAFSLGEILVALAIVGVIASLILPAINQIQPDRQKMMFKKAYTNVERVVTELVNDDYLYPEASKEDGTKYQGLDNTTAVTLNDTSYSGNTKFCQLFAMKMNTIEDDTITCNGNSTISFTTNDSVAYYMPNTSFATEAEIMVDINGDQAPNCKSGTQDCKTPDRYSIYVAADGKVSVKGELEKSFLRTTSVVRESGKKESGQNQNNN